MRNPVLNIGSNCVASDIPDWSYAESGLPYDMDKPPSAVVVPQQYDHMFQMSPSRLIDRIKVPLLLLLGQKDVRVPNYEALNWYHYLRSRGRDVDLLQFPEDGHALDGVQAEHSVLFAVFSLFEKN